MKLSDEFKKAMRNPNAVAIELTPERKQRIDRICGEIIDELVNRTETPFEAIMVLHFVMDSLQETYGITSGITVSHEEAGNG